MGKEIKTVTKVKETTDLKVKVIQPQHSSLLMLVHLTRKKPPSHFHARLFPILTNLHL
jgi:hypothetical protein